MSANVTTPVMVTIDSNGNYQAVKIAAQGSAAPSTPTINQIAGINTNGNIIQYVNVLDSGTASGSDVTKLIVDQYKQFNTYKNYFYGNQLQSYYDLAIRDAIGDWSSLYGAGYDDIKISVVANGLGPNNFHYYVTIIRWN
jgi:hypothetical protein